MAEPIAPLPAATRVEHAWPRRWLRTVQFGLARLTSRDGFVTARAAPFDLTFTGPAADVITRHIYRLGTARAEPAITRYLLEHVRLGPTDVALDIGANLGWYSVLLNRLSEAGARIYAFEPDPQTFKLLRSNLTANQAMRVNAFNFALGKHRGARKLRRYKDSNNGRHSLIPGDDIAGSVTVPLDTLAHFWEAQGLGAARIAFMKVDVEGFEYFVLKGAGELLRRCDNLLLEYSPASLALAGLPADALIELLEANALTARAFVNGRPQAVSYAELRRAQAQLDLLLSPRASRSLAGRRALVQRLPGIHQLVLQHQHADRAVVVRVELSQVLGSVVAGRLTAVGRPGSRSRLPRSVPAACRTWRCRRSTSGCPPEPAAAR